ncbi:MAG: leucyl/phenylalanyl-tRNA--protein transferase [Burkholderiaceae bacterium]|nr:leucyl/phenylalanyl-tRNA--protein transferase [Burkholderiaceae bacterium]
MIPWLETGAPFPDVSTALTEDSGAPGLLAASASLSPMQLLDAYRHGIFPWYSIGQPVLWWSTDPRMVLKTDQFKISRSLEKRLKQVRNSMQSDRRWQVTFDAAFTDVMRACAAPRKHDDGTWITDEIIAGYTSLHRQGLAHSVELWHNGRLAGGLYGVAIGRMFYGESMFARETDASKVALAWLVHFLKNHGVSMIDCQQETAHLASLGAAPIPRSDFIAHLRQAVEAPPIGPWEPVSPI